MDKVRIGLISSSWWQDFMFVPSLKSHPKAEIVAVSSRSPEPLAAFASKHGIANTFADYRKMLTSGLIDAVVVGAPDDLHKEMALAALDAGLHVLCEKPLALNAADATEMTERAKARGVKHMVYYTWRWQPPFQYLKQLIEDGWFGRILRGQFSFIGAWGLGREYQWRHDGKRANGVLGDLGSHMVDLSRWMLGDVERLTAHLPILIDRSGFGGDVPGSDTAHLICEFRSGAQGVIDATTIATVDGVRILVRIDGEDGSIEIAYIPQGPNIGVTVRGMRKGDAAIVPMEIPAKYFAGYDITDTLGPYRTQPVGARLFLDAIVGDFTPEPGFEVGLANQRVIDAAMLSHRERRWVDL